MVDNRISFFMVDLKMCKHACFRGTNEFMVDSRIVSLESTIDFFRIVP